MRAAGKIPGFITLANAPIWTLRTWTHALPCQSFPRRVGVRKTVFSAYFFHRQPGHVFELLAPIALRQLSRGLSTHADGEIAQPSVLMPCVGQQKQHFRHRKKGDRRIFSRAPSADCEGERSFASRSHKNVGGDHPGPRRLSQSPQFTVFRSGGRHF